MVRRFDMHNPSRIIDLAMLIQTDVYWDEYYYLEDGGCECRIQAKDLLPMISAQMDKLNYIEFNDGDIKFVYNVDKED